MTRINLVKYGFIRTPSDDFTDDSNRFTCYKVGRVRVTKLISDGEAYIDGAIRGGKLPYEVYSKLPHYTFCSKLNGVPVATLTDEDLQELYESCQAYDNEYTDAENSIKYPTLDEITQQCMRIYGKRLLEVSRVEQLMSTNACKAAVKLSTYEWKTLQEHIKNLIGKVNQYDPATYPQSILGQAYSFSFVEPDNSDLEDCFYYKQIVELFEKKVL